MRNHSPIDAARFAFQKAVARAHLDNREPATVGWRKAETEVILAVPGRANYLYITKSDQTVAIALNRAGVPKAAFLPVWVVLENNTLVITGRNNADAAILTNVPDSDYGVHAHPLDAHSDVTLTALADGEILEWDATAGKWVNTGIGAEVGAAINAATADTPLAADKFGFWDVVDAALKSITWTNLLAAIHSAAHALTNKTVDSTNIASLTAKNPPVNADSVVIVDSAAANVFKAVTWANIKATLKAYFDTLYGLLAGTNVWTGSNTFDQDVLLGSAGLQHVRLDNTTGTVAVTAGTSTTEGPYMALVGKDQGGSEDGSVQYASTTESSALGDHIWFVYNGTTFQEVMRILGATRVLDFKNIPSYLGTSFNSLYVALTGDQTIAGIKRFSSAIRTGSSSTIYLTQEQAGVTITDTGWTTVLAGLTGVSLVYFQLNSNATNFGGVFYVINNGGTITITPLASNGMVAGEPGATFNVGYQASGTSLQMKAGSSWPATIGCNVAVNRLVW